MPEKQTIERAREAKREGKAPTTQAGEFIREEMDHIRGGKHGARSTKQAIAIGLSKARRAGVDLPPPKKGKASEKTRTSAKNAYEEGQKHHPHKPSPTRSRAISGVLKHEGHKAASHEALSRQASTAAHKRTAAERSASARKGMAKRSPEERSARRPQGGPDAHEVLMTAPRMNRRGMAGTETKGYCSRCPPCLCGCVSPARARFLAQ